MFYTLKIFRKQVSRFTESDLVKNPFRHYFSWRRSLKEGASSVRDELPWITFEAIDLIKKQLSSDSQVFEFGGGGSTLFFLKNGASVYTTEHDKEWFEKLTQIIAERNYKKWKGNFIRAEDGTLVADPHAADPAHYASADKPSAGKHYKAYSSSIDNFENNFFDLVLVDGRSRPACMLHAVPKIKKGGMLVLDNSDRDYYLEKMGAELAKNFTRILHEYGPSPYSWEFTKTSIWIKR